MREKRRREETTTAKRIVEQRKAIRVTPQGLTKAGWRRECNKRKHNRGEKQCKKTSAYLHADDSIYEEQHHYKKCDVGQCLKRRESHQ